MFQKVKKGQFYLHPKYYYLLGYNAVHGINYKILDYGCRDGEFVSSLTRKSKYLYGVDVDIREIIKGRKAHPKVKFALIKISQKTPYRNNFFDIVFLFHALEHVDNEQRVINECYRILKKNGKLIIASPYKGIFSWADVGNIKFRFPRLHQLIYTKIYGEKAYREKYQSSSKQQLFGDITITRKWHKHYKENQIRNLLKGNYTVENFIKYSCFMPFLLICDFFYSHLTKRKSRIIMFLIWLDNHLRCGELSNNMYCVARKK